MLKVIFISRSTLNSVPGGDTIQIHKTKEYLEKAYGIEIDIWDGNREIDYPSYDLIHFFNIIRPNNILLHLNSGLPYVLSPIYVDYSEYDQEVRGGAIQRIAQIFGKGGSEYLKSIVRWLKNGESPGSMKYFLKGYNKSVREILNNTAVLLPNSTSELKRISKDFVVQCNSLIVPNAVDVSKFNYPSSKHKEGILCVARIEGLKNQLNLIKAVMKTDYKLTIIGKPAPNHLSYYNECLSIANEQISFVDHVDQDELQHYYRRSKVHAMVSWFETTGLSSLEAAACGCNILISEKGDQKEYFKDDAFYAEADDVDSIKNNLVKAYEAEVPNELMERIANVYTWENTARITMQAYEESLKS